MTTPSRNMRVGDDLEFLRLAATRIRFPGASILGSKVVPDEGFSLQEDKARSGVIFLRNDGGGGGGASISCSCALEGGGCAPVILDPGGIGESAVCIPDGGCGTSGLFCFMDFDFGGGLTLQVRM